MNVSNTIKVHFAVIYDITHTHQYSKNTATTNDVKSTAITIGFHFLKPIETFLDRLEFEMGINIMDYTNYLTAGQCLVLWPSAMVQG